MGPTTFRTCCNGKWLYFVLNRPRPPCPGHRLAEGWAGRQRNFFSPSLLALLNYHHVPYSVLPLKVFHLPPARVTRRGCRSDGSCHGRSLGRSRRQCLPVLLARCLLSATPAADWSPHSWDGGGVRRRGPSSEFASRREWGLLCLHPSQSFPCVPSILPWDGLMVE